MQSLMTLAQSRGVRTVGPDVRLTSGRCETDGAEELPDASSVLTESAVLMTVNVSVLK